MEATNVIVAMKSITENIPINYNKWPFENIIPFQMTRFEFLF